MEKEFKKIIKESKKSLEKMVEKIEDKSDDFSEEAKDFWSDLKKHLSTLEKKLKESYDHFEEEAEIKGHLGMMEAHDRMDKLQNTLYEFSSKVSDNVNYTPWLTAPAPDGDNDGLLCCDELAHGTDPNNPDTDGDGWTDGEEVDARKDPLDPKSHPGPSLIGVGGEAYPVNKLAIMAPWIGLAVLLIFSITWLTLRRQRSQS